MWRDGDLTLWREADVCLGADFRYWAICEAHGSCVGTSTKQEITSIKSTAEFCEVCNGTQAWCRTCGAAASQSGACEDAFHDIGAGRMSLPPRQVSEHRGTD